MSELNVQFEALASGAEGINSTYARLIGTLDGLESDLGPMVASWSGSAQEAYLTCKKRWEDAATELARLLSGIGQSVHGAHDNYVATEDAATKNWT